MKNLNLMLLLTAAMFSFAAGCQSTGDRYPSANAYQVGNPLPVENTSEGAGYQPGGCQSCGKSQF